jgi:hypothetical protein
LTPGRLNLPAARHDTPGELHFQGRKVVNSEAFMARLFALRALAAVAAAVTLLLCLANAG